MDIVGISQPTNMAPSLRRWTSCGVAAVIAGTLIPASNAWILDKSCDPYKDFITTGMQDAFELAKSGKDVFDHLQTGSTGARAEAQKDAVSYLFKNAMTDGKVDHSTEGWSAAAKVFNEVLGFDTTGNGGPQTRPGSYKFQPGQPVDSNKLNTIVIYCDLTRYKAGEDCNGKKDKELACDTSVGLNDEIEYYTKCNNLVTSLEVCTIDAREHD